MLMASLVLHQLKEVGTVTQKEINTECKTLTCVSLAFTILSLVMVAILHYRKSKLCRGCMISNVVEIMIFISDVQYYVPIKLCKNYRKYPFVPNNGHIKSENIKLNQYYIWDTLEINWKEVSVTCNDNKINLPRIVTIKLRDKILFHIMLKQGITWFTLALDTQETVYNNTSKTAYDNIDNFPDGLYSDAIVNFVHRYFRCLLLEETMDMKVKVKMMRGTHTFRRDCTTHIISCKPWSPRLHPYLSRIR